MISIKVHKSYRTVVAVADADLIGKTFEEGIRQLKVKESFFKGEEVEYERAVEIMKFQAREDATFNIVGEKAVKAALEAGIITDEGVGTIDSVPYALVLM